MSEPFERTNNAFLTAGLAWLRLRLLAAARQGPPEPDATGARDPAVAPPVAPRRGWFGLGRRPAPPPPRTGPFWTASPPPPPDGRASPELQAARQRMEDAAAAAPTPALTQLAASFGLSSFERDVLFLCAAMELDPNLPGLLARAGEPPGWPTFALAFELFEGGHRDALSPQGPLRRLRLLEINQAGNQPLLSAPLRIDERIGAYVGGLNYLDERLAALLPPAPPFSSAEDSAAALSASQDGRVEAAADLVRHGGKAAPQRIQITGADAGTRRLHAQGLAERLGREVRILGPESLPPTGETDVLLRLWEREDALLGLALVVELPDADLSAEAPGESTARLRLLSLAERSAGLVLVSTLDPAASALPGAAILEAVRPTPAEQAAVWRAALGEAEAETAEELAAQFSLDVASIRAIAGRTLATQRPEGPEGLRDRLWAACVGHSRPALEGLAQKIEPRRGWSALKLPDRETQTLERICDQMRLRATVHGAFGFRDHLSRGLGTAVLFSGESGTGKTLAAEVLASELKLALYRIDIAGVMNKYIGVTEKNLRQIFDAGDGAILFFDECDALFSKRSEVKDSHDRYANIQVDYLLQRIESYCGLAILATNLRESIDPAFLRRLRFVVNFPFPSALERAAIWRAAFPPGVPLADIDFERLGALPLTGGNIQNVALDASFRAAAAAGPVTMALIAEAAREEMRKMDRAPATGLFRTLGDERIAS